MLSVAIVTMIEEILSFWMKTALIRPQSDADAAGDREDARASRGRRRCASVIATYCATDAVAVKEMSMPPATSTTRSPAARMPMKALEVSRSNRFCSVRKLSVASDSAEARAARIDGEQPELVTAAEAVAAPHALTAALSSASEVADAARTRRRCGPARMISTRWVW